MTKVKKIPQQNRQAPRAFARGTFRNELRSNAYANTSIHGFTPLELRKNIKLTTYKALTF